MKINLHVNWTLISCYKQTSLPQNRLDVSLSLSLLFQGNWFGPAVINQIEAFLPGGGTPHMKGVGMVVVSLRGVDFGFWSHLGCSGQNVIIFSREGLV